MKKFRLGKKEDGEEDSGRLALFGSRSKPKSPAPSSTNPYAANPYAQPSVPPDPYTKAKMGAGLYQDPNPGQAPSRPSYPPMKTQDSGYSSHTSSQPGSFSGGYPADSRFGPPAGGYSSAGYGGGSRRNPYETDGSNSNPYANISQTSGTSRYGPGGYGGLGRTNSNETATIDANRDELFGSARERAQQKQETGRSEPPSSEENPYNDADQQRSYGAYGDRQLTAEEEEEEDITATKQEVRFIKQQDVSSTPNALQMAAQAEETGRNTLARLGAQGERIHNTERNLDLAENATAIGEDKIGEVKKLNRSMFVPTGGNPFTAKTRREKREEEIMDRHRMERDNREATREAAFKSTQRMNQSFKTLEDAAAKAPRTKTSLAERAKYQFEADSEDDQMEDEIERNLDELSVAARRLNLLARATGQEVEQQNEHLSRIAGKVGPSCSSGMFFHSLILCTE